MATIARGTKAGTGTTDFGTGTTILASEVNTDLNTIVNAINGGLDADNLAANAVGSSEIQALAVTTDKLAALGVTAAKIAADAVTTSKILDANVTIAKMGVSASQRVTASGNTGNATFSTVETDIVVAGAITRSGGPLLMIPTVMAAMLITNSGSAIAAVRYYRDATVLQTLTYVCENDGADTIYVPVTFPPCVDASGTTGSVVYKITGQTNAASLSFVTATGGTLFVWELA